MSSKFTKLLMGSALMALAPATNAFADGTQAGTGVTNTFSLSFTVGGDAQTLTPEADDTVTFVVDREIDLTVATSTPTVTANPGDTTVTQVFTVTNTGNSTQAYDLDFFQQADGTAPENFDTTVNTVALEVLDANGATITTVNYTPNPAAGAAGLVPTPDVPLDGSIVVTVTSSVPNGQADNSEATIALEANTLEPATPDTISTPDDPTFATNGDTVGGAAGSEVTATGGNGGVGTVETVLADGTGTGAGVTGVTDVDNDGDHSAVSVVTVQSANVEADKSVALISQDGTGCAFNGASPLSPTAAAATEDFLPGACVLYTIDVSNTGTATATGIRIDDTLQSDLIFVAASPDGDLGGNFNAGDGGSVPAANQDCDTACLVTLVNGELATGETGQLLILAQVK